MKVLLVAATASEAEAVRDRLGSNPIRFQSSFLVTGVGMTATAYSLTRKLAEEKFDLVLNIGIAGSFDPSCTVGSVVAVTSDRFYELGAEDGPDFLSADVLGLVDTVEASPFLQAYIGTLKPVKGITVNKVHGDPSSIAMVLSQCPAQVESMEGAAFYYVCNQEKVRCLQIRAISNAVERRNREAWDVPAALKALGGAVLDYLQNYPA
jgi:futalosine hydrolase